MKEEGSSMQGAFQEKAQNSRGGKDRKNNKKSNQIKTVGNNVSSLPSLQKDKPSPNEVLVEA